MEGIIVITYLTDDNTRLFKCERNNDSKVFKLLRQKLFESSYLPVPSHGDGWMRWLFRDKRDEASFLEAFKWYIIYE